MEKESEQVSSGRGGLAELGFDPKAVLLREAGALFDRKFVGALHRQVEGQLGAAESAAMLLQMGFLRGLQEARRVITAAFSAGRAIPASPTPLSLAIRCATVAGAEPRGAIEVHGTWPERSEASARRGSPGESPETGACFLSAGFTSGWLSGLLDADVLAIETRCRARGHDACGFVAREAAAWRAQPNDAALALLDALPFEAFRELVARHDGAGAQPDPAGLDPDAAVIHIWGPVMVVPFGGTDESLRAVEMIGRDPGARDVSVLVVDLTGAIVDETFGALALERILETAEAWGAEVLFAGAGPLSQRVVSDLARQPLVVEKDLSHAIAVAFQIAEAQRRLL